MNPVELERLLHARIPLSKAMGVEVIEADCRLVRLHAPLDPNTNPHGTAFGGSIASLCLLAGWSMAYLRLFDKGYGDHLVISETRMEYLAPMRCSIQALCLAPKESTIEKFIHQLERRGKARIELKVEITGEGVIGAHFHGEFVAMVPVAKEALV